jgi:REP-associated tyrosine transposase
MSTKAPLLIKYRYRRRLPHLQKADAAVFVTFCTGGRQVLPEAARDLVLEHCRREGGIQLFAGEGARATRVHLYAVVVMPDHVHLLLSPLRDPAGWPFPLVDILQCLKSTTAHRVNKLLRISGPLWEEESFDHVLRSDESLKEKCEYIQQNPVKAVRPNLLRLLLLDRTGVRLLFENSNQGQRVKNRFALDLQLPSQVVDANQ